MTTKKLAKLIEKLYLKLERGDTVDILIEREGLVKVVEQDDSMTSEFYVNLVGDDIITYGEDSEGKPNNKIAISEKQFKRLVKAVCSVRRL